MHSYFLICSSQVQAMYIYIYIDRYISFMRWGWRVGRPGERGPGESGGGGGGGREGEGGEHTLEGTRAKHSVESDRCASSDTTRTQKRTPHF